MDKYGHNVNFLALCTGLQKVTESIQSRLQVLHLPRITRADLQAIMMRISRQENLAIDANARHFLLNIANGSVRTMINFIEKLFIVMRPAGGGAGAAPARISLAICEKLCTDIPPQTLTDYIAEIKKGNLEEAMAILFRMYDRGFSVIDILDNLFSFLKIGAQVGDDNDAAAAAAPPPIDEEEKYKILFKLCNYIRYFYTLNEDCLALGYLTRHLVQELGPRPPPPAATQVVLVESAPPAAEPHPIDSALEYV